MNFLPRREMEFSFLSRPSGKFSFRHRLRECDLGAVWVSYGFMIACKTRFQGYPYGNLRLIFNEIFFARFRENIFHDFIFLWGFFQLEDFKIAQKEQERQIEKEISNRERDINCLKHFRSRCAEIVSLRGIWNILRGKFWIKKHKIQNIFKNKNFNRIL